MFYHHPRARAPLHLKYIKCFFVYIVYMCVYVSICFIICVCGSIACRCVCSCFTGSLLGVKSPTLGWVAQIAVLEPVFDCTCTAPPVLKNACSLVRFEKANTNVDSRRLKLSARRCPPSRKVEKEKATRGRLLRTLNRPTRMRSRLVPYLSTRPNTPQKQKENNLTQEGGIIMLHVQCKGVASRQPIGFGLCVIGL